MKDSRPALEVRQATANDTLLLESMLRFYVYDFSEFEDPDTDRLSLDSRGEFRVNIRLADYLTDNDRWVYVIFYRGYPAGFAFLNTVSHVGLKIDRNMGEFFIARKYRRSGLATMAFHEILLRHPGRWEIAVIEPNAGARAFWPRAIESAPKAQDLRQAQHDGTSWKGPVWTFTVDPV